MQTGAEKHPECSTGAPDYDSARPTAFGRESGLTNPRPAIGKQERPFRRDADLDIFARFGGAIALFLNNNRFARRRMGINIGKAAPAPENFATKLRAFDGIACLGPRFGSKTADFQIPADLPPGLPPDLLDFKITRVESLHPQLALPLDGKDAGEIVRWREFGRGVADIVARFADKEPFLARQDDIFYCCGWPDERAADNLVTMLCDRAHVETARMPEGVRRQQRGRTRIYTNYGTESADLGALEPGTDFFLDGQIIPPAGVSIVISDNQAGPA